jgi:transcriptional regulator with XRE-family HTH domain
MTAGEKMRALRGSKSKETVAQDLGISLSSYTKYERDERTPRPPVMMKIANYYKRSVNYIFFSRSGDR